MMDMKNNRMKSFGKDLDAILGNNALLTKKEQEASPNFQEIPIDKLFPRKEQPRKNFDNQTLEKLSDSVLTHGVLQAILVHETSDGHYEIIAGERRWRAAKMAGLHTIPALICDSSIKDKQVLSFSVIENIQRENLDPIEEAMAFLRFQQEFHMSHADIAESIGRSRSSVTNTMRLLLLPELVKEFLQNKQIEMGHARALLGLPAEKQVDVAQTVVKKSLSVRQTEKLVQQIKAGKPEKSTPLILESAFQEKLTYWKNYMSKHLESKVSVHINSEGQGKVTLHFNSVEEADWLIDQIQIKRSSLPRRT